MGLTKCPDCGKEISVIAPACVHCGRLLSNPALPAPTSEELRSLEENIPDKGTMTSCGMDNRSDALPQQSPSTRARKTKSMAIAGAVLVACLIAAGGWWVVAVKPTIGERWLNLFHGQSQGTSANKPLEERWLDFLMKESQVTKVECGEYKEEREGRKTTTICGRVVDSGGFMKRWDLAHTKWLALSPDNCAGDVTQLQEWEKIVDLETSYSTGYEFRGSKKVCAVNFTPDFIWDVSGKRLPSPLGLVVFIIATK